MQQRTFWTWLVAACAVTGCAEPKPLTSESQPAQSSLVDGGSMTEEPSTAAEPSPLPEAPAAQNASASTDATQSVAGQAAVPTTTPQGNLPSANVSAPAIPVNTPSVPQAELRIKLVRGVALAQTLPEGSAMGFSLEYFVSGVAPSSSHYEWVIEHPQGTPWRQQLQLDREGSLATFVTEWPPEPGTYKTYIQEIGPSGEPKIVSNKLDLTYSY